MRTIISSGAGQKSEQRLHELLLFQAYHRIHRLMQFDVAESGNENKYANLFDKEDNIMTQAGRSEDQLTLYPGNSKMIKGI
jgi:hypothetical protein